MGNFWVSKSCRRNCRDVQAVDCIWKFVFEDCIWRLDVSSKARSASFSIFHTIEADSLEDALSDSSCSTCPVSWQEISSLCWYPPAQDYSKVVLKENVVNQLILVLLKEPRHQETTVVTSKHIDAQRSSNTDRCMQVKILIPLDGIFKINTSSNTTSKLAQFLSSNKNHIILWSDIY